MNLIWTVAKLVEALIALALTTIEPHAGVRRVVRVLLGLGAESDSD